jgi:hypothetical protein
MRGGACVLGLWMSGLEGESFWSVVGRLFLVVGIPLFGPVAEETGAARCARRRTAQKMRRKGGGHAGSQATPETNKTVSVLPSR